jgi:hypothetical protein
MKKQFSEILQPSFKIDFWLRHFRGLDYNTARTYEKWLSNPVANSMFFGDTTEFIEEEQIDIIDNCPPSFTVSKPIIGCLDEEIDDSETMLEADIQEDNNEETEQE